MLEGVAEAEMSLGVFRIELDGVPVCGNGFRAPALLLK